MFLQASQLLGSGVFSLADEGEIARIERLIIDPQTGAVMAFGVKPHGWFTKELLVAQSDVVAVDPHGIAVRDTDQLVEHGELVRVAGILAQQIPVLGQKAATQSGNALGTINDLLLDVESWTIAKYYLRQLLHERILLANQVHSMTKQAIIFLDEVNEPDAAAAPETATV